MLGPLFDSVQQRFPGYVFELRQVFMLHNLPIGTEDALPVIALELASASDLRVDVARILRAMIRQQREQISSVELLAVLMEAAGHSPAEHSQAGADTAIEEILGFILEIRHPHQNSAMSDSPALLRPGKDDEYPRPGRAAFLKGEPEIQHIGPLFEDAAENPESWHRRALPIAACTVPLLLSVGIALHSNQHGATGKPQTSIQPGAPVPSDKSEQARSVVHRPSIRGHKGWFADGNSLRDAATPARHSHDQSNANVAIASPLPAQSGAISRTDVARVGSGVQPVQIGMAHLHEATASLPSDGRTSPPPAIIPVDLRPSLVSYSKPDLHRPGQTFVQTASAGIMAANVVSSPAPAYPPAASSAGVQGEVQVHAVVGRDGNVLDARVVSGPPLLRDAALQAIEQWQYRPYLVDGKPSVIATTAIVDFKLARP